VFCGFCLNNLAENKNGILHDSSGASPDGVNVGGADAASSLAPLVSLAVMHLKNFRNLRGKIVTNSRINFKEK